jgi:hypothetical protein
LRDQFSSIITEKDVGNAKGFSQVIRLRRRVATASAVSPRSRKAVKTAGLGCWSDCPRLKPGVNENHEEFCVTPRTIALAPPGR